MIKGSGCFIGNYNLYYNHLILSQLSMFVFWCIPKEFVNLGKIALDKPEGGGVILSSVKLCFCFIASISKRKEGRWKKSFNSFCFKISKGIYIYLQVKFD